MVYHLPGHHVGQGHCACNTQRPVNALSSRHMDCLMWSFQIWLCRPPHLIIYGRGNLFSYTKSHLDLVLNTESKGNLLWFKPADTVTHSQIQGHQAKIKFPINQELVDRLLLVIVITGDSAGLSGRRSLQAVLPSPT